jgi:hypothetical protein
MVYLTVGDPWGGGARVQLTFPYLPGCEDLVVGEPAELLVLSQGDSFTNFKVRLLLISSFHNVTGSSDICADAGSQH